MFNKLVASEGRKTRLMSPVTFVTSIVAHFVILGGLVYAAENTEMGQKVKEEMVTFMEIEETPKAPEPEPEQEEPPPPEPQAEEPPPVAKGFQDLVPPEEPPTKIPDVDLSQKAINIEDFSGVGTAGGVSKGIEGGIAQNMAEKEEVGTGPIDVALAEEKPKLQNAAEVQRLLQRLYPPLLRDAGITGTATIKFVVNAQGRVDPGSVSVVSSTHEAFGEASTKVGEKLRFKPAKVGGRAVPVLVTMPVTWTLDR